MKTYKASDLTHKRSEVLTEARKNGVLIEERRTNGDVINTFELKLKPSGLGSGHSGMGWKANEVVK